MTHIVNCIKLMEPLEGLDFPPYPGPLGKRIWENVSKEAWGYWLQHQTQLVSHHRLRLADAQARQYLTSQMQAYFFETDEDVS